MARLSALLANFEVEPCILPLNWVVGAFATSTGGTTVNAAFAETQLDSISEIIRDHGGAVGLGRGGLVPKAHPVSVELEGRSMLDDCNVVQLPLPPQTEGLSARHAFRVQLYAAAALADFDCAAMAAIAARFVAALPPETPMPTAVPRPRNDEMRVEWYSANSPKRGWEAILTVDADSSVDGIVFDCATNDCLCMFTCQDGHTGELPPLFAQLLKDHFRST